MRTTDVLRQVMKAKAHQASLSDDPTLIKLGDFLAVAIDDIEELLALVSPETKNAA